MQSDIEMVTNIIDRVVPFVHYRQNKHSMIVNRFPMGENMKPDKKQGLITVKDGALFPVSIRTQHGKEVTMQMFFNMKVHISMMGELWCGEVLPFKESDAVDKTKKGFTKLEEIQRFLSWFLSSPKEKKLGFSDRVLSLQNLELVLPPKHVIESRKKVYERQLAHKNGLLDKVKSESTIEKVKNQINKIEEKLSVCNKL